MHRMRCSIARVVLILPLAACFGRPAPARADLIRPDATQSFPDLSGDIVGTQKFTYDPSSRTGTFQVESAPSLLAVGAKASAESYVFDPPGQPRTQSIQLKLDSAGRLVSDSANSYSLYGSVTVDGKNYSGLLLKGTPDAFGYLPQTPGMGKMSVYDMHMTLSDGALKGLYGPDAYVRIIAELGSSFDGTFTRNFDGQKALTNVRAYNANFSAAVPEPSTFAILAAFGGVGLFYRRRQACPGLTGGE